MQAVFLSYAHADAEKALRLYGDLTRAGVFVWLDQESLLPGQPWKPAIESAIRNSRYFIALLSTASVNRRGYVQKELVIALDVLDEFPSADIFIIPARLEECTVGHPKLRDLHWVDLYPDWDRGVTKILRAIGSHAEPSRISVLSTPLGVSRTDRPRHSAVKQENATVLGSGSSSAAKRPIPLGQTSRVVRRSILAGFTLLVGMATSLTLGVRTLAAAQGPFGGPKPQPMTGVLIIVCGFELGIAYCIGLVMATIPMVQQRSYGVAAAMLWVVLWSLLTFVATVYNNHHEWIFSLAVVLGGFICLHVGGRHGRLSLGGER